MKRTYQPKKKKRRETHGFLKRSQSSTGRRVLKNRRRKGRKKIA
jgi:large subunit ribosomal protein L34